MRGLFQPMNLRVVFPAIMFATAGGSFAFGIWQYVYARNVQASAAERMAYIMTTIERSDVSRADKKELYATIEGGLPAAPTLFGIDVSGSFASQDTNDHCTSDGQRAVCRALYDTGTDTATTVAICGLCQPK
jgi:hypothetical protein